MKKKCNHVLLKFQPTNLSILSSSYSKKRLNGPFTIWRSSGRKVAHDNLARKGKQPTPRGWVDPKARLKFGSLYKASIWRLQVFYEAKQLPKKKASNQTSNKSKPKNFWNLRPLLFSNKKLPPFPKIPSENCWWCFFARRSPQLKKILPSSAHQWLALARVDQSLPAGIRNETYFQQWTTHVGNSDLVGGFNPSEKY